MNTLNFEDFLLLRSDPAKYWRKERTKEYDYNDLLNRTVKVLYKNPKSFEDVFIFKPDISEEDSKGVDMQEILATDILSFLENVSPELPEDFLNDANDIARKKAGLPKDYVPTSKLIAYGEYLMIKDERIEITKAIETEADKYAKKIRGHLPIGNEITPPNMPGLTGAAYDGAGAVIWVLAKAKSQVILVDLLKSGKKNGIILTHEADYIKYVEKTQTAYITNIHVCDNVLDFPSYFNENNLSKFIGFQKLALQGSFTHMQFNYLVFDKTRRYSFAVKNIPDLIEEVSKANYTIAAGSNLPYEYDSGGVVL